MSKENYTSSEELNKIATGESLKYLGLEFSELDQDINQLMNKYFQSFRDNKREIASISTLKIIHGALSRIKFYLDNYHSESKDLFYKFKESIVSHNKDKLIKIFGEDYQSFIDELVPGKDLGDSSKHKIMMELVGGEDKVLLEDTLRCLFEEPVSYGSKYQEIVSYFNYIFSGKGLTVSDYNWIGKYNELFKFADIPSYFDVRNLFPGKSQGGEPSGESLDPDLTSKEKEILTEICSVWDKYKTKLDSLLPLTERAYLIDKSYKEVEEQRNEELHSIFDRIKAIRYIMKSFISEKGQERDFYETTGLTFKNAYAKVDSWVYVLLKVFPPNVSEFISKNFIKKPPRTMQKGDTPYFSEVKDYEAGEISDTEEEDTELLYRETPENSLPSSGFDSHRSSEYDKSIIKLKKLSKKR